MCIDSDWKRGHCFLFTALCAILVLAHYARNMANCVVQHGIATNAAEQSLLAALRVCGLIIYEV